SLVQPHTAMAETELAQEGLRRFNTAGAFGSHLHAGCQAAREAGGCGLVPGGQSPGTRDGADVCLGAAGFLQRMADAVLRCRTQAGPIVTSVIKIGPAANDIDAKLRQQFFDAAVEFDLAKVAARAVVANVVGVGK